jgi:hypothetical protein
MKAIKLLIIVQSTHEEQVRKALGDVGAGTIGSYTHCQFATKGEAQFMPVGNAAPAIGERFQLNIVPAVQIQTWCFESQLEEVVQAIKAVHPNEEPAIELVPFEMR